MNTRSAPKKKSSIVKKLRIILLSLLGLLFVLLIGILIYVSFLQKKDAIGNWRTEADRKEYEHYYADAMKLLPPPDETNDIPTTFGTVRLVRWDHTEIGERFPLLLIPGRTSGTPMWKENLPGLTRERTVYALDVLGDAGMSVQSKPIKTSEDQAIWIKEVMDAAGIQKAHVVGHSFGGWNAVNLGIHYPEMVASLVLLEPVFVIQAIPLKTLLKIIPATIPFLPESWKEKSMLTITSGERISSDDPTGMMIDFAAKHFSLALPMPEVPSAEQTQQWSVPVWLGLGGKSFLGNAERLSDLAREKIDKLTVQIWEEGTHSLLMEYPDEIDQHILQFVMDAEQVRAPIQNGRWDCVCNE